MEQIKNQLKEREKVLIQMKKEKEKALSKAPEGKLRVCHNEERTRFYQRLNSKDFNGVYIKGKNHKLAQALAQKDYDEKVLRAVEQELKAIEKYNTSYPKKSAEQIFRTLHKERQKIVVPIIESDEEYIRNWEAEEYNGKEFYEDLPEFYTAKGERVRSKSEVIIADSLHREGIPYRYEYPIYLEGMGIVHPDFTVLNVRKRKEMYFEHLGMMDDEGYAEKNINKIFCYQRNGIFPGDRLMISYETRKHPLNQKDIILMIQKYLQ